MKKGTIVLLVLVIIIGVKLFLFFGPAQRSTGEEEGSGQNETSPTIIMSTLTLASTAFKAGDLIPAKYTCDGENIPPELLFSGVPAGTVSLTLIMDDPDIPENVKKRFGSDTFDHWVVFNIMPGAGTLSAPDALPVEGVHSAGAIGYTGPCPPDREHHYFFKLYALDIELPLKAGATKADVEQAMEGHVLDYTELVGRYDRER